MRRAVTALVVLLLIGAVAWALWPDSSAEGVGARDADSTSRAESAATARAAPRPLGARVAGVVLEQGRPVGRARVTLRGAGPLVTLTLDDGQFLFDDVPSGAVYLAAASTSSASEVLGPLQLAPGGRLEGLVLDLQPAVQIDGRLIDLVSRRPIAGATVISPSEARQTDAEGRFTLRGPRAQTWLELSAPGFLGRTEWVGLELARAGGRLDIVMTPASRVAGLVTEAGTPVAAATVWAERLDGPQRGERSLTVFTDKAGRFSLETAAGTLQLSAVTPAGTRVKGPSLSLAIGEARADVNLEAGVVTSAHGVVTRAGLPVAGARVSAIDAQTEDLGGVATTGPDGQFRFDGLVEGRYVLQVLAGAVTAVAGPFTQQADGQPWVVALVAGATLEGRVEPPTAGVRVRWRAGSWAGPSAETATDGQGVFRFEGLPDEWLALDAEGPAGGATARARPGDAVVLRLQRAVVVVHMRDGDGAPVTDGVVVARSRDSGTTRRQLVLAPDGVARLDLPPGQWVLRLEVSGRGRSAEVPVEVRATGAELTLALEHSVTLSGRVVDAVTQLPLAGALVSSFSGEWGQSSRASVRTDARGEFVLPPIPRGAAISAWREGYAASWRKADLAPRWEVALQPTEDPRARRGEGVAQFEGVGMTLDGRTGAVLVAAVNEGSPAERAGVLPGDQVLAVDGAAVQGQPLGEVVGRIRGPAGAPVVLRFRRGGQDFELTLRRRQLTL